MRAAAPWIVKQEWSLTYQHVADEATATFLEALRDDGRLLGRRCPQCRRVLVPPLPICDMDHCATDGWVELPLSGQLQMATVVFRPVPGLPDPPYALAYVRIDEADTAIPGRVEGLDLSSPENVRDEMRPGRKVELLIANQRVGRISDLSFRLL